MTDLSELTGSAYSYQYRALPATCASEAVQAYVVETRRKFAKIAKDFDDAAHTQWLARNYLALKLVLGATIMASSAEHAQAENLQVTLPYLNYYTLLSCARAVVLTHPDTVWQGQRSIELTHQSAINTTANALRQLDPKAEQRWGDVLRLARDHRELYSYRFPASGLRLVQKGMLSVEEAQDLGRLLAEIALLHSQCLESAVRKHAPGPHQLLDNDDVWLAIAYETKSEMFVDDDDWMRVSRFFGSLSRPIPLDVLATPGLLEDFFGAWSSEERGGYDPDDHWSLLLELW